LSFPLSDDLLQRELLVMTDWYTDELFALPASEAVAIRYPVSRLVLDPERFIDDQREVMASRGMGVIYTRLADGRPLRDAPTQDERRALIARFYEPHHEALTVAVKSALAQHGRCLVVDCHSFPSQPLLCDLDQAPDRPDICIGTDLFHTPSWLIQLGADLFAAAGLSVGIDRPYSGALVPAECYGRQRSVCAIMIEINRRLYMHEGSGDTHESFPEVAGIIQGVLRKLLKECQSRCAAQQGAAPDGPR
jgi:N-formylglutamate amidohydrolase